MAFGTSRGELTLHLLVGLTGEAPMRDQIHTVDHLPYKTLSTTGGPTFNSSSTVSMHSHQNPSTLIASHVQILYLARQRHGLTGRSIPTYFRDFSSPDRNHRNWISCISFAGETLWVLQTRLYSLKIDCLRLKNWFFKDMTGLTHRM